MPNITLRQLEILQHAVGADCYGRGGGYRNHFCAGVDDEPDCRALVERGYMEGCRPAVLLPYYNCSVTAAGLAVIREMRQAGAERHG